MFAVLAALVCALVSIVVEAAGVSENVFTYVKPDIFRRTGEDVCKVCYGDKDCLTMNQSKCEFYTMASDVLYEEESPTYASNPDLRARVNNLMADLSTQAYKLSKFQECVPFISEYTDCTKENICLGCQTCMCNVNYTWNCSFAQHCRPEDELEVDHRTLVIAIETLRGDGNPSFRLKRSIGDIGTPEPHNLTFEEIAEWMYEAKPLKVDVLPVAHLNLQVHQSIFQANGPSRSYIKTYNDQDTTLNDENDTFDSKIDDTSIAFEDMFNSIFVPTTNYARRKTLNENPYDDSDRDYMNFDYTMPTDDISEITMSDQFMQELNSIDGKDETQTATTTEAVIKVIDLLKLAKKNIESSGNDLNKTKNEVTLQNDTISGDPDNIKFNSINIVKASANEPNSTDIKVILRNNTKLDVPYSIESNAVNIVKAADNDFNNTNIKVTLQNDNLFENAEKIEYNAINIMKRDATQVTEAIPNVNITKTNKDTQTITQNLENSVYLPISAIIRDKQKELEDLLQVREKLIELLNLDRNNDTETLNETELFHQHHNHSDSHINFYNLQIVPQTDYKRSGSELLNKHMNKLIRDVYAVTKDIINVQTITGHKDLPRDIKVLAHAIKHFMRNHTKFHTNKALRSSDNDFDLRRYEVRSHATKDLVKNTLIDILLSIDKNIRETDPLAPLSKKTRKIVKRIIKNNKVNEYSVIGLRVSDPHYNLTNDLKSIGVNWQDMTARIAGSSPWDRLHYMKLLQFILASDIMKMADALALIDFAHSRRMVAIHDDVNKGELSRINNNLKLIYSQINEIRRLPFLKAQGQKVAKMVTVEKPISKKESFLKHLKNLLRSSKIDVLNFLRKKTPKPDIVKELARKRLKELAKEKKLIDYEKIIKKWQNQLAIRKKRSVAYEKFNMRTKNILPKYLRGKVSSGMNSTKHKYKPKKYTDRRKSSKVKRRPSIRNTSISSSTSETTPPVKTTIST